MNINSNDKKLLEIVEAIACNPKVKGIGLGGSRGLGFADQKSDYDVVVYYSHEAPVDNEDLLQSIKMNTEKFKPTRSGRRLNGVLNDLPIEVFYRDTRDVESALAEISKGTFSLQPDRYFPQGKLSIEHLSYLVNGKLLYDQSGELKFLIEATIPMPRAFRRTLYEFGMVGAETALKNMRKARRLPDHFSHLMAHVFLFVWYSEICLFALNEKYPFSSKQTSLFVSKLPLTPKSYLKDISEIYSSCARGALALAVQKMVFLLSELKMRFV